MPHNQATDTANRPHFNFLLQPEFPMNALILASDALRIANQNSGRRLFAWTFASEDGKPVRASNGMWFETDCAITDMPRGDVYLLFEGNLPTQRNSSRLLAQLRAAARYGAVVGSVDTGAFALAQAGLIGTEKAADAVVHWEAAPTFLERFPNVVLRSHINLISQNRAMSAGGVAALDLVLDLIEKCQNTALANEVANALVHIRRSSQTQQRSDMPTNTPRASLNERIVMLMEQNLDFPIEHLKLAKRLGISRRTLTRECQRKFGISPMKLYKLIRLQAARNFLFYEEYSIKEIALACGFSYPAVFARAFKAQFGATPSAFRTAIRKSQQKSIRPEIMRLIAKDI